MLIVDAYNVLHSPAALGHLSERADAAELACMLALAGSGPRAGRVLLVCDGRPPPDWGGRWASRRAELRFRVRGVEILFAGAGADADSLIESFIAKDTAPRRLRVVSSDRRVAAAARRRGAQSISAERFVERMVAGLERSARLRPRPEFARNVPLGPEAVRHWIELFQINPDAFSDDPRPGPSAALSKPASAQPAADKPAVRPPLPRAPDPTLPDSVDAQRLEDLLEDEVLLAALEEWRGRLSLDDLDMRRWLGDTNTPDSTPKARPGRRGPTPSN
jgi:hypothetical protein